MKKILFGFLALLLCFTLIFIGVFALEMDASAREGE